MGLEVSPVAPKAAPKASAKAAANPPLVRIKGAPTLNTPKDQWQVVGEGYTGKTLPNGKISSTVLFDGGTNNFYKAEVGSLKSGVSVWTDANPSAGSNAGTYYGTITSAKITEIKPPNADGKTTITTELDK